MEIYSLRVLGARVQNENYKVKIKVSKSRALGESPFLTFSSFYWVLAFLGLGPPRSSFQGQHLQISLFSVFTVFLSPYYILAPHDTYSPVSLPVVNAVFLLTGSCPPRTPTCPAPPAPLGSSSLDTPIPSLPGFSSLPGGHKARAPSPRGRLATGAARGSCPPPTARASPPSAPLCRPDTLDNPSVLTVQP